MKNCNRNSRRALAMLLGVLSSGCLSTNANKRNKVWTQECTNGKWDKSRSSKKLILLLTALIGTYGAYRYGHHVIRHELYEGSKELKGVNLTQALRLALNLWYSEDDNDVAIKDECVKFTYKERIGDDGVKRCITVYDISLLPMREDEAETKNKDLIVFGPNCYSSVLLFNPQLLEAYDHVYLVERSGYGAAKNDIDVPENMDGLYEGAEYFVNEILPENENKRELLCFSMGGAETSRLMNFDEFKDFTLLSPVCLQSYFDNNLLSRILRLIYPDLDVSWARNMIEACNNREESMVVSVMSGDSADKLCAVKSLANAAEALLGWTKPQGWDDLSADAKANQLVAFYNSKFQNKLNLSVDIYKNISHEGNALVYHSLHQMASKKTPEDGDPVPAAKQRTFLDYMIEACKANEVNIPNLEKLLNQMKNASVNWA